MYRRYNLVHLILAIVIALVLTPLMVCAAPPAQIAFVSEREGTRQIYVMDADGGNLRNLTNNDFHNWDPSWSPNGKRIAFTSRRAGDLEIYVMDTNGSNQRNLTNQRAFDFLPSWSPDGERIAFVSMRGGMNREIYVMDADGDNPQRLTNMPRNDIDPTWFDPAFAVAPAAKKFTIWGWLKQDVQ